VDSALTYAQPLYTRALSLLAHTAFIESVRSSRRFDGESVDARLQKIKKFGRNLLACENLAAAVGLTVLAPSVRRGRGQEIVSCDSIRMLVYREPQRDSPVVA